MYGDNSTLSPRSPQYWPMNHCVQNTTPRRSVFEKLRNSEIIFLIIVSLKSGMENSIIQELNATHCCRRNPGNYTSKCTNCSSSCLISWHNLFMKHFKFVSWQSGGSVPRTPRRGFAPGLHRGCARTSPPPSTSTPSPASPTTRMPASGTRFKK